MDTRSDLQLVELAQKGDRTAWSELVNRYAPLVYSVVRRCRVPESEQPDVFQYAFVELHAHLPKLNNPASLPNWLKTVTLRQAVKVRQQSAKVMVAVDPESWGSVPSDDSIDLELETVERDHALRMAVAKLDDRCRQLIELLFLVDPPTPYAEVAVKMGFSVGSIGMTRQRCLDALERTLRALGWG